MVSLTWIVMMVMLCVAASVLWCQVPQARPSLHLVVAVRLVLLESRLPLVAALCLQELVHLSIAFRREWLSACCWWCW